MEDTASYMPNSRSDPPDVHFAITPSNDLLEKLPQAIYCTEDGVAHIEDSSGVVLAYPMSSGTYLPFRGHKVLPATTGTYYGWCYR